MADEYRSRDLLSPNGVIETALEQLYAAAAKTDPGKPESAVGKDHQALRALLRSRILVDAAAGWALDHVYGLSLAGHKMVPSQPDGNKGHPDYLASREAADKHDHEREGGARINQAPASPELRRLILRNLVSRVPAAFLNGSVKSWSKPSMLWMVDLHHPCSKQTIEAAQTLSCPAYNFD